MAYNILDYLLINIYLFMIWNLLRLAEPSGNLSADYNLALLCMLNPPHPSWKAPMERVLLGFYAKEPIRAFFFQVVIKVG